MYIGHVLLSTLLSACVCFWCLLCRSYVEVQQLPSQLLYNRPSVRPLSLSTLAMGILGAPLDKTQQCSDWGARPLTPPQIRYAANDAHCLLLMWQSLQAVHDGPDGAAAINRKLQVLAWLCT